jgi:hypothetical protein
VQDSKIIIEDVTNTKDTSKKAQVIAIPAEGGKKMVYGYCTDQVDGTSFIGGIFDQSATSYPYAEGLAIGGTSGNLLWKGKKVLTVDDSYVLPTASSTLGGVKTTSTVTSTSGLTACPIISGVVYYKDTNTTYTHPTTSGNKHIPSGGSSGQILRWSADGTAVWGADNNTTYSAATTSAAGLMSAADKTKLNYTNVAYGTCSTAAATAAKVVTVSNNTNWALTAGSIITILFSNTNTAENPTLNVNGTGAKAIKYCGSTVATSNLNYGGYKNRPQVFMYDGTSYHFISWGYESGNTNTLLRTYKDESSTYPILASRTAASSWDATYESVYGTIATNITMTPSTGTITATAFSGSGASLTSLNASNISSGTIAAARLPAATTSALGAVKVGTGLSVSSGTISNSGVRSISTGSTNGTISVNTNGSSAEVAVKGLGSNAYTSTAYLPLSGGTMTGALTTKQLSISENSLYINKGVYPAIRFHMNDGSTRLATIQVNATTNGNYGTSLTLGIQKNASTEYTATLSATDGTWNATKVTGAVWNDYAEYRDQDYELKPGYITYCDDDGKLKYATERLQHFEGVVSDTFGFAIGETDNCRTPLAVSGRVLVYCDPEDRFHAGDCVCAGPNGIAYRMTREEIIEFPDRIVGTVSEIPTYETWGSGNVAVDGRIWIKVR